MRTQTRDAILSVLGIILIALVGNLLYHYFGADVAVCALAGLALVLIVFAVLRARRPS